MKIDLRPNLPYPSDELTKKYLTLFQANEQYDAYTLDESFNIVKVKGSIENNESYNYHNNYDDSRDSLYFRIDEKASRLNKYWTVSYKEIKELQKLEIDKALKEINDEVEKLNVRLQQ